MSDISIISAILVVIIAFFAGLEGILDQFQMHQPLVACTLIGLVTGHLEAGVILGGTLQMLALGWANIGAAVALMLPLPLLQLLSSWSKVATLLKRNYLCLLNSYPTCCCWSFLTMIVRTLSTALVHAGDKAAAEGNFAGIERFHFIALLLQGLRIAVPAALLVAVPTSAVQSVLNAMPNWLNEGMQIGGAMVVAVGYAMVINMMATREVWPFFALGFALAAISQLTLIAMGVIGVAIAFIYLNLSKRW